MLQPPLIAAQPHRNQQLFSDYFLDMILPQRPEWQALIDQARPVMHEIAALYANFTPGNEAQTEDDLVKPVLTLLGHTFEVQAALWTPDGTKKPDYVFYRDAGARDANKRKTLTADLLHAAAFAVGDAKQWDRSLDQTTRRSDALTDNPVRQIALYMQHSKVEWGMLTNGRLWRLYHRDTVDRRDRYYEIDLPALLESGDAARFLYFYAFFHRSAFEPHPLGVAALLRASTDYARGVGDTLKAQVYDALRHLAQGFLDYAPNRLQPDPATLKQIYDHALIVLYRLLFIFYAEARELLPIGESTTYRDSYSLRAITHEVAQALQAGRLLRPNSAMIWQRLRDLFRMIDQGDPPLKVATFNGGLFDPERHPFLEQYAVGDARLQQALDKLARVGGQFVDYRDLSVRHLGTIYEGLLEYHLERPGSGDGDTWERANVGTCERAGPHWTIDLLNDKGERKATGSYYTPDYIVKYIVDQTVGPVLRAAVADQPDDQARINAVLDVNVLDPAMGSGHFLVEATEYIARFLVDLTPNPVAAAQGEADLADWKRRVAQSCIYGVDLNPLAVDLAKLSLWLITVAKDRPLSFLDHHLRCGNALVGARIADLQVGAGGAGAQKKAGKKAREAQAAGQISMLDDEAFRQSMSTAVDSMWLIEQSASNTVAEVKEQAQTYARLRAELTRKYGRLADLVTATYFGVQVDPTLWQPLADYATGRTLAAPRRFEDWLQQADAIAEQRRFFHWELEFPEVFFDRHGQPLGERAGFDAVVGNPPYVRSIRLKESDVEAWAYYSDQYHVAGSREYDIYLCFVELGLNMLNSSSYFGMIIPNKWFTTQVGEALRAMLAARRVVGQVVDFAAFQVFENVTTYTCLLFLNGSPRDSLNVAVLQQADEKSQPLPNGSGRWLTAEMPADHLGAESWNFALGPSESLLRKLSKLPRLQDLASVFKGTGTSADQVYFMERQNNRFYSRSLGEWVEIEEALMRPALTGRDIDPYFYETKNYLLFPYRLVGEQAQLIGADEMTANFPKAWAYLNHPINRENLEHRDNGEFRRRSDWYGYGRPQNLHLLHLEKLVGPDVAGRAEFACDLEGRSIIDTVYAIRPKAGIEVSLPALATLLNSSLMTFFLQQTGTDLRGGYFRMKTAYLNPFPIPAFTFTTPPEERERLRAKGEALYAQFCQKHDYACVLGFVEHHLPRLRDGSPDTINERSDVVHDLLAFLAQQMIELHQQRHAAVEDFALDLEGVLAPADLQKIGRLWTPPAAPRPDDRDFDKKQAASAATMADAQQHLGSLAAQRLGLRDDIGLINEAAWKWLIKGRLKKIESLSDLIKLHRRHQPAIAALDARIVATDRLIDRIVYALYGLSEEEIAVVEGSTR